MDNDSSEKKTFDMTYSYYIFFHSNVYFVFVARTEINDENKMRMFYLDLKKDIGPISRGDLKNL